jgi:ADP-L-glycero-D-manno-heptose 6-epimerase
MFYWWYLKMRHAAFGCCQLQYKRIGRAKFCWKTHPNGVSEKARNEDEMIIVTGANGFIGSALVWELNNLGHRDLVVVDRIGLQQRPSLLGKQQWSSFLSEKELLGALKDKSINPKDVQWVIHLGACSDTTETNQQFLNEVNLEYSQHLWTWCTQNQIPLVYASSAATYGAGEKGFDDTTSAQQLKALNLYGESKRLFDGWVETQKTTPPHWYGLKFFNVYGPQENHKGHMASVVQKAVQQIQGSGRLKLFRSHRPDYGDGRQMRDFVYVKDVTRWIAELIHVKPRSGIYNMGYGEARTWLDLANGVFSAMGLTLHIEWIDMPWNIRDQYQYWTQASMGRFFDLGVSRPQWNLEAGVHDYVTEYLLRERGL